MASYTLPEEITGIPLYVPNAYDQFSIVSGGMPNGDNSLRIRGDISQSYRAFQQAQTLTPNIFLDRAAEWAVTFWFKCASTAVASGTPNGINDCLFGVTTAAGPNGASQTAEYVWCIGRHNNGGTGRIAYCAQNGGGHQDTFTNACDGV